MTEPLYTGIQGVDVNWMATLPGMEDIEELAASLPEKRGTYRCECGELRDNCDCPAPDGTARPLPNAVEACPKCGDKGAWFDIQHRLWHHCDQREEAKHA